MESTLPDNTVYDLLVIGGGINGCAIAADAAGRGLTVLLCEQNDLASGTSSWSTKLIHGGLRYLELYEFSMVRKALQEREILLERAPHLIQPLKFILPHEPHLKPKWIIRAGLFMYDHLTKQKHMPRSRGIPINQSEDDPLKASFTFGYEYYDCLTDDSRLVILNAQSAKENGAVIHTHTEFLSASRQQHWEASLHCKKTQNTFTAHAKAIINATGPWINELLDHRLPADKPQRATLIKGSHIVVNRIYDQDHAYILQTPDQRIVFTIPYQKHFTLIGTTDISFDNDPSLAQASSEEVDYLIRVINQYFKKELTQSAIIWDYSGVRSLYNPHGDDPKNITREFHFNIETQNNLPLLSVFGGKITTHRLLAEQALNQLRAFFPNMGPAWTGHSPLPGGDIQTGNLTSFIALCQQRYSTLPKDTLAHYAGQYGSQIHVLLKDCHNLADLGQQFGPHLFAIEIDYLIRHEWALTLEDIIWRRTKAGLILTEQQTQLVKEYLHAQRTTG